MKNKFFLLCSLLLLTATLSAQSSREYIRNSIRNWGECRNVAITKYNGDVALYGRNGCARSGVPSGLNQRLTELNNQREFIDDVQLTDGGAWLILWGNNGISWNDIPYSLERKLREWNNEREVITSVTFNDAGQWIAVSQNYISASEGWIQDWLAEGGREYGLLYGVCITDDAMVATYEGGFKFYGNVPYDLKQALRECHYNVYRVKIAGTAWFFSDGKSRYRYNM